MKKKINKNLTSLLSIFIRTPLAPSCLQQKDTFEYLRAGTWHIYHMLCSFEPDTIAESKGKLNHTVNRLRILDMRFLQLIYAFLSLVSIGIASHYPFEKVWENTKYLKSIDVGKSFVKERYDIEIKNKHSEPVSHYIFGLPRYVKEDISLVIALTVGANGKKILLKSSQMDIYDDDILYYTIALPYPISPGSEFSLSLSAIITKQLVPYPENIPMEKEQVLKVTTNVYPLSPYDTDTYSVALLSVTDFHELPHEDLPYSLIKGDIVSNNILYEATEKIPSDTVFDFSFTFSRNAPLTYVNYLKRDLWISHWSSALQLEEYYEITNHGAKLDKGFSRAKYFNEKLAARQHHAITALRIPFDKSKTIQDQSIYFVDKVGNVSTSQYYNDELVLRPRFPLFGGWNYNFTIGWNYDLKQFLRQGNDEYILSAHILDGIRDTTYGKIDFSIYLPEGAELIDYSLPFSASEPEISNEYSYLDIENGHTKISFEFENIVDEMKNLELILRYRYSTYNVIQKPLLAAFYLFLALMGLYVLKKIDLSIKPTRNGRLVSSEKEKVDSKK